MRSHKRQTAQRGQLGGKIGEEELKGLLERVSSQTSQKTTVKFDRRRNNLDSDDDDYWRKDYYHHYVFLLHSSGVGPISILNLFVVSDVDILRPVYILIASVLPCPATRWTLDILPSLRLTTALDRMSVDLLIDIFCIVLYAHSFLLFWNSEFFTKGKNLLNAAEMR